MFNRHVLVLVSLNDDFTDSVCHLYPECGRIEHLEFSSKPNINTGLYGTLWGKPLHDLIVLGDTCVVVKVNCNEELFFLDKNYNIVKFKEGDVVFSGSQELSLRYIEDHKQDTYAYSDEKSPFDYRNIPVPADLHEDTKISRVNPMLYYKLGIS